MPTPYFRSKQKFPRSGQHPCGGCAVCSLVDLHREVKGRDFQRGEISAGIIEILRHLGVSGGAAAHETLHGLQRPRLRGLSQIHRTGGYPSLPIDEVFMDVTNYLSTYGLSPRGIAERMIQDVLKTTGITATAEIGPNLYLCKVAMDIVAKRIKPDENGVRIASLNEQSYRRLLWDHRPLTDIWMIGRDMRKAGGPRPAHHGRYRPLLCREINGLLQRKLLYQLFGVNAELLIDHAWGWEPCTIADIKAYKPEFNSPVPARCCMSRIHLPRPDWSCAKWQTSLLWTWWIRGW